VPTTSVPAGTESLAYSSSFTEFATTPALSIAATSRFVSGTLEHESTDTTSTDETTAIIIAVTASAGGVLLLCFIVACVVKKAKSNMLTETTRTSKGEVTPERSQESQYHSAVPLAAALYNSSPPTTLSNESDASQYDSTSSSGPAYHRPPAIMTTDIQHKVPPRGSVRSNILASEVGHQQLTKSIRTTEVLHIPIDEIEMGKQLGQGAFGVVYKGQWDHKTVAVKQVKASNIIGGDKAIAEFEAEVSQMASTAYHENLVQLYGVTTLENGDMAAVVEFCAQGSLVDALYGSEKGARLDCVRVVFSGAWCGVRCGSPASAGRDSSRHCGAQRAAGGQARSDRESGRLWNGASVQRERVR
jgi:hypothetical protein